MPQDRSVFRLGRRGLVLAMTFAVFASPALANTAAKVDFSIGAVTATGKDGRARPLTKGGEVLAGDRVVTRNGRAQLRFTDGAYVSLQPNTTFEVREYNFDGRTDGTERGIFGLLRGAMRTVTGLIGRVNRNAYQIQTPTATVGIRGTGGIIEVLADGTTRVTGTSGIWYLAKPNKDVLDVPAGTVGEAGPNPDEAPKETSEEIVLGPPQPEAIEVAGSTLPPSPFGPAVFVSGDQVPPPIVGIDSGSGTVVPTPLPNGNYDAFTALGFGAYVFSSQAAGTTVTFGATGAATQIGSDSIGAGTVPEYGNVSPVAWGRWTGNLALAYPPGANLTANQGYHYVLGIPAPALPVVAYVPFTLMGATSPTVADGSQAPGSLTGGQMGVDFTTGKIGLQFNTVFSGFSYAWSTPGGAANPAGSNVAVSSAPKFSGSIPVTVVSGVPPSACASGCTGSINGAFFGAGASHAGLTYQGGDVSGAAVFKQ